MTVTKFYLIDSRLNSERSVEVQIQFHRIASERVGHERSITRFAALASDYDSAIPFDVDLPDGVWVLEFVSYVGNYVACTMGVPSESNAHHVDAAILDGHISSPKSKDLHYALRETHDKFSEKSPRRFVTSSAGSVALDNLRNSRNRVANKLKVTSSELEFQGHRTDVDLRSVSFLTATSFEQRLDYWLKSWNCIHRDNDVLVQVEASPGRQLCTGRLRIVSRGGVQHRTMLNFMFTDERYVLIVPHLRFRPDNVVRFVDIEVDFFDVPETSTNGRISQVRVLTDNAGFNGVVQLLSKGRLYSANSLGRQSAEDVLQAKYSDPIAAAAGALALVQPEILATMDRDRVRYIWGWLSNLDEDFSWLPEGPICRAWMLAASGKVGIVPVASDAELRLKIAQYMMEAIDRGLPVYSEGLNLLSKAVDWASSEIDSDMTAAVRWLALHSVNVGPFVLLRDRSRSTT